MSIQKINSFLEKFWLVVGVGSLIYGIYYVYVYGLEGNFMYLIYPLVAFALFGFRRAMRIRLAKQNPENQPPA